MRNHGLACFYGPALLACLTIPVAGQTSARDAAALHDSPTSVYDPDAGLSVDLEFPIAESEDGIAADAVCDSLGAWSITPLQTSNVYRATVIRIQEEARLVSFQMEMAFSGTTDLYFSVHQRQPDGRFVRFTPDLVRTSAIGNNTRTFYSSGNYANPVRLDPGFDYALGVSWGAQNINFNRSTGLTGMAVGIIGLAGGPPVAAEYGPVAVSTLGAYSMRACFEPVPGACCHGGTCQHLLATECVGPGSFFHGQRTSCDDTPCRFGACCSPCNNDCLPGYTPEACANENGTHSPGGVCPADSTILCPIITGACCIGGEDGTTCVELCIHECLTAGGTFRGEGTDCQANVCEGACCVAGFGCLNATQNTCANFFGGAYRGDGTTCATLPPAQECGGACCFSQGEVDGCSQVTKRADCTSAAGVPNAVYFGDARFCPADCPSRGDAGIGACCTPTGQCVVTRQEFCENAELVGGTYLTDGTTCVAGACVARACCFPGGTCAVFSQDYCVSQGGTWQAGVLTCQTTTCNAFVPTGACCASDGTCTPNLTATQCGLLNGLYQGHGSTCGVDTCPGFGACCLPDGSCLNDRSEAACDALNSGEPGGYQGNGARCATLEPPCEDLRGACCTATGTCLELLESECADINGVFHDGETCGTTGICPAGACCLPDGSCGRRREDACAAQGGLYAGDNLACTGTICVRGACCRANGTCQTNAIAGMCTGANDIFTAGQTCAQLEPSCSALGACCLANGTCEQQRPTFCQSIGGVYQGGNVPCGSGNSACTPGACCTPTDECGDTGDSRYPFSCEAQLGHSFLPGALCTTRPCDPVGACCTDGTCRITSAFDCEGTGGVYQGDDSTCTPGRCALGGCCHLDGTCQNNAVLSQCQEPNDDFRPGQLCQNFCVPRGACCTGSNCQLRTAAQCAALSGTYDGHGQTCRENLCEIGACCMPLGTDACNDTLTRQECEQSDGIYQGSGLDCDELETLCLRGSCCDMDGSCESNTVISACSPTAEFRPGLTCAAEPCVARGACCVADDPTCEVVSLADCLNLLGGSYSGDGVSCEPGDLCVEGACCLAGENCLPLTRQACEPGGSYLGVGVDCLDDPCAIGACCDRLALTCADDVLRLDCFDEFTAGETCDTLSVPCELTGACCDRDNLVCVDDVAQSACVGAGVEWALDTACADLPIPCTPPIGACCDDTFSCTDGVMEDECVGDWTADTTCALLDPPCVPPATGACCQGETCTVLTADECDLAGGVYLGDDVPCDVDTCTGCVPVFVSVDPPNCAIDARYPTLPSDAATLFGWSAMEWELSCLPVALAVSDFAVTTLPDGPAPALLSVTPNGDGITLTFDGPIQPGRWTCVEHLPSGLSQCLGFLPADANSDRTAAPADILTVIDNLNGVVQPPLTIWQCDIDRSGLCAPADILGVIDLLNGSGAFEVWLNRTIPACPSAP